MDRNKIVLATRKSALALAQSRAFARTLEARHSGLQVELLELTTTGDRVQDRLLSEIGGKGLFVKEIEEALLDGRADFAVHSLKDVPPELPPGLVIGCMPAREDPRDVLISRSGQSLAELPAGSVLGTSSLRRRVQVLAFRPDLELVMMRGNVDTRLRKCREGAVDAILLARAGLLRLGLAEQATEIVSPSVLLPAVGQGTLGVEHRRDDARIAKLLAVLADPETTVAASAERAVMRAVEGSCQFPVAAYATRDGSELNLAGFLAEPDGSRPRRASTRAPWPTSPSEAEAIGTELGRRLRAEG